MVGHFWCVLPAILGPPLCVLDDEGGHPSVVLVFWLVVQFGWLFSLAGCSVWLVVQFGWLFSLAGCLVQLIVVCTKPGT